MDSHITLRYQDAKQLYKAYMPFVANGALFVKTNEKVELGYAVSISLTLPDAIQLEPFDSKVIWSAGKSVIAEHHIPGYAVELTKEIKSKIEKMIAGIDGERDW